MFFSMNQVVHRNLNLAKSVRQKAISNKNICSPPLHERSEIHDPLWGDSLV